MPDITAEFTDALAGNRILELDPSDGLYTVVGVPSANLDQVEAVRINGNGARLWFPDASYIVFDNPSPGPSNQKKVILDDVNFEGAGIKLQNPNRQTLRNVTVKGAITGVWVQNTIPEGQAEYNHLDIEVINCTRGFRASKTNDAWGSMRGTEMWALVSGATYPYEFHRMGPYASNLNLHAHVVGSTPSNWAAFCFRGGNTHGSNISLLMEGETEIALYLEEARTPYTNASLTAQTHIGLHTIHAVEHVAIYDGLIEDLPSWRFTHGDPHNGNHLRPQWTCADGQVF
jgi:hypothetical protein